MAVYKSRRKWFGTFLAYLVLVDRGCLSSFIVAYLYSVVGGFGLLDASGFKCCTTVSTPCLNSGTRRSCFYNIWRNAWLAIMITSEQDSILHHESFDIFLNVYSLNNNLIHLHCLSFSLHFPKPCASLKSNRVQQPSKTNPPLPPSLHIMPARNEQSVSFPSPIPSSSIPSPPRSQCQSPCPWQR